MTRVAIDPTDSKTVWATFSGFRNGETAAHVYKTTDGGETWVNNSGNLPNAPLNDVVIDVTARHGLRRRRPRRLQPQAGRQRTGRSSARASRSCPCSTSDLHGPTSTLYASTFGRSMWKVSVDD